MKKISIALITCFILLNHSFAQVKLAYKAGLNISKVKNKEANNFTTNLNFNTGLVSNINLNKKLLIDLECILSAKGFNSTLIPSGETATRLYYLTFPVLLQYNASQRLYFQLGPELNFLVDAKMKNKTQEAAVPFNYNKVDVTLAAGLGFSITKNIRLEARYSYGLSQIKKNPDIFGSQYNRTLQFNLLYFFH